MNNVDLARIQFATTTLFHFLFVPVTIGLSWLTAITQTAWRRTGHEEWLRLTRFVGRLLLINVAVGVATGLVQEFQFGMNWSTYARYVGDVFGAPLAIEGLAAFFLESTFLGVWVFGWDKLSPRVHLATIYIAAIGATLSAVFILAANSWMQNPVGYTINPQTGRAQLNDIGAVFGNRVFLWALPHTLLAALVTASAVLLAVSCWHLRRDQDRVAFTKAAAMALVVMFPAAGLALMTGAQFAVTVTQQQPMKVAGMEALWGTEAPASFSLVQFGGMSEQDQAPAFDIEIPHLLSVLATSSWDGQVQGINSLEAQAEARYGPGYYTPTVPFCYWGLRVMAYLGTVLVLFSGVGVFLLWRGKLATSRRFLKLGVWMVVAPFLVNSGGWILAETGRQPWIVWGLQRTADAASPNVGTAQVALTLVGFVVIYGALAVIDLILMMRYSRRDLDPAPDPDGGDDVPGSPMAMSY